MDRRERIKWTLREYEDPDLATTRRERIKWTLQECEGLDRSESINSAARFDNDHDLVAIRADMLSTPLAPVSVWDLERDRRVEESRREWNRTAGRPAPAAPAAAAGPVNPATIGGAASVPKLPAHLSAAATGAPDDDAAYWAEQARCSLPAPFGDLVAQAIESCERTKKSAKLIPGAPGRRGLEEIGQSAEWAAAPPTDQAAVIGLLIDGANMVGRVVGAALGAPGKPPPPLATGDTDTAPWAPVSNVDASAAVWPAVASGLAFTRRLTLLSGIAKDGKSTLTGAAAAGVADGADWLTGEVAPGPGSVIWIGAPGESQADEVRRLAVQAGASAAALGRIQFFPMRPSAGIVAALAKHAPADLRLVVIDSARGLLTADGGEEDRSDDVRRTLGAIAKWQADHGPGAAVIAIHHMRRDREARTGDRTRGSGDWLAAVDLVVEFDRTATGAKLTYSGRTGGPVAPSFLTWRGGRFMMGRPPDAPVETDGSGIMDGDTIVTDRATYDRVLDHLARTPADWQSTAAIAREVGYRKAKVITSLDQLVAAGRVERRDGPRKSNEYRITAPVPDGAAPGGAERWEQVPVPTCSDPVGTGAEQVTGTGPGPVPDPIGEQVAGTGDGTCSRVTGPGTGGTDRKGPPPPDRPAENPDMPPPDMTESDQRQIDSLEAWMMTRGTSWHVTNPDPDSPVPGRFALAARDPDAPDWARRVAVKMGRRALAKQWRAEMLAAGLNPDDRPNPWTETES